MLKEDGKEMHGGVWRERQGRGDGHGEERLPVREVELRVWES